MKIQIFNILGRSKDRQNGSRLEVFGGAESESEVIFRVRRFVFCMGPFWRQILNFKMPGRRYHQSVGKLGLV